MRILLAALLAATAAAAAFIAPGAARADEPPDAAAVAEARKHFAEGQRLFDKNDLRGAVEEFKEAYRLTRNPLLLYNIGFVYDKLGDEPIALHYYGKFIDDAQDNERTHAQLAEASTRATALRAKLGVQPAPSTQPVEPPPAPPPRELVHEPIDQAPPGKPIDIVATIPRDLAWTVTLNYRAPGIEAYQATPMKPVTTGGTELVARIPAGALRGTSLQYYVAARDPDGKLVSSSGRAQTPHIIYLDPQAPPHLVLPADAEAGPEPPVPPPAPRFVEKPRPTRPLTYAKWATSIGAGALIIAGTVFLFEARSYSDTLEAEAIKSSNPEECPTDTPPPCRIYSQPRKDLQTTGQRFERWSNIGLFAGGAAAIGAGVLWYLDSRESRAPAAIPVVGPGTVGAAAVLRF